MTGPHISDELPRMLTGEAGRETVLAAAAHLRDCVDCQHELVSALVAHASLTSAQRFAPEIVSGLVAGNFADAADAADAGRSAVTPLRRVTNGDAPVTSLVAARHATDDGAPDGATLPDMSAVFAQVRAEAASAQNVVAIRPARPARLRYLAGAAAAAVLLGGAGIVYAVNGGGSDTGTPSAFGSPVRTVKLAAYDVGTKAATAQIHTGGVTVDATSLPKLNGKRYEVWLTNDQRTEMQPIGWIGRDGKAALTVPVDLMTQFNDLEVSVQSLNANDYVFSGTSVLRGSID